MNYPDFFYNIARFIIQPKDILAFCQVNKLLYSIMKKKFLLLAQIRAEYFKSPYESVLKRNVFWKGIKYASSDYIKVGKVVYRSYRTKFNVAKNNLYTLTTAEISSFEDKHNWKSRRRNPFMSRIKRQLKRHPSIKENR